MSIFTRTHCPNCKNEYPPHARACDNCGRKRDQRTVAEVNVDRRVAHEQTLTSYRANRSALKAVRILPANDACPLCKSKAGDFPLDNVPPLPHENCTHHYGCRCCYSPVVNDAPTNRPATHPPAAQNRVVLTKPSSSSGIPLWVWPVGFVIFLCSIGGLFGSKEAPAPTPAPAAVYAPSDAERARQAKQAAEDAKYFAAKAEKDAAEAAHYTPAPVASDSDEQAELNAQSAARDPAPIRLYAGEKIPDKFGGNAAFEPQGSDRRVWVNLNTGVYHFPGSRWYGNTKNGAFMTQTEALSHGYSASQK